MGLSSRVSHRRAPASGLQCLFQTASGTASCHFSLPYTWRFRALLDIIFTAWVDQNSIIGQRWHIDRSSSLQCPQSVQHLHNPLVCSKSFFCWVIPLWFSQEVANFRWNKAPFQKNAHFPPHTFCSCHLIANLQSTYLQGVWERQFLKTLVLAYLIPDKIDFIIFQVMQKKLLWRKKKKTRTKNIQNRSESSNQNLFALL